MGPEHVSAYALTIEPATPLGRQVARGDRAAPRPRPPGRDVRDGVPCAGRGRLRPLRGLELGATRLRVPAQPRLLGTASVRGARRRRARLSRRPALVERTAARGVPLDGGARRAPGRWFRGARTRRRLPRGGVPASPDPPGGSRRAGWRTAARSRTSRAGCSSGRRALSGVPTERGMPAPSEGLSSASRPRCRGWKSTPQAGSPGDQVGGFPGPRDGEAVDAQDLEHTVLTDPEPRDVDVQVSVGIDRAADPGSEGRGPRNRPRTRCPRRTPRRRPR